MATDTHEYATPRLLERARALWAEDDLEIDEGALVSRGGDSGVWVAAWVWVPDEEEDVE